MHKNTIQNLQILQAAREDLMKKLKTEYTDKVIPFIQIINKVMKARELNEFEAVSFIKDNLSIYNEKGAPLFFSAALMEIVEEKNFKELRK